MPVGVVNHCLETAVAHQSTCCLRGDGHLAFQRGDTILRREHRRIDVTNDGCAIGIRIGSQPQRRQLHKRIGAPLLVGNQAADFRVRWLLIGYAVDGRLHH
jgi:hypothetical protein